MFFQRANSVEKQLLNFKNASVSHCFRNSLLTIIWNNLSCLITKVRKGILHAQSSVVEYCSFFRQDSLKVLQDLHFHQVMGVRLQKINNFLRYFSFSE